MRDWYPIQEPLQERPILLAAFSSFSRGIFISGELSLGLRLSSLPAMLSISPAIVSVSFNIIPRCLEGLCWLLLERPNSLRKCILNLEAPNLLSKTCLFRERTCNRSNRALHFN